MDIRLNKIEKEIIIGSILGDGYLGLRKGEDARLEIKQSENKIEYVKWLYHKLARLNCGKILQRKDNSQWYFRTKHLRCLTELRNLFYKNGKKIIPDNIGDLLKSPLTLAVWYMDDGNIDFRHKYHYSYIISTNCFSFTDVKFLTKILLQNFFLKTKVHTTTCRMKKYPRLYVGLEGREKFVSLVKPYILPCFKYKLPKL